MLIKSTQLAVPKQAANRSSENISGVIVAVPRQREGETQSSCNTTRFDPGVYVVPTSNMANSAWMNQLSGIAKNISVEVASRIHPHLGTGVRAGWVVVGALSLLEQARDGTVPWHKIALKSGELALESWGLASPALPDGIQLADHWADGLGFLIEATAEAADGNDVGEFVFEKALDQSPPVEFTRQVCSLVAAAHSSQPQFASFVAEPIEVSVEALADNSKIP